MSDGVPAHWPDVIVPTQVAVGSELSIFKLENGEIDRSRVLAVLTVTRTAAAVPYSYMVQGIQKQCDHPCAVGPPKKRIELDLPLVPPVQPRGRVRFRAKRPNYVERGD
jgi:hypothetical protein